MIKWEVTYNSKYGQPGPLAYKLDTLIVNRRIEEARRPIPRIIRLGSLREITQELGISTHATSTIKRALRQNAFAGITAKIRYRLADGSERTLEADFTRYSVVFTGEELPDGRKADAVYLILNDIYMQVINGAMTPGFTHQPGMSGHSRQERAARLVPSVWQGIGCFFYHRTPG